MDQNFGRQDLSLIFDEYENHWAGDMEQTFYAPEKNIAQKTSDLTHQEIPSRSFKKKVEHIQISFEDSILDKHEVALQKQGQNFMEAILLESSLSNLLQFTFWKDEEDIILDEMNIDGNELFSSDQRNQFKKDLEAEQNLKAFLKMTALKTSEQVGKELTYIAMLAWEKYLKVKTLSFNTSDLMNSAQEFVRDHLDELFESNRIKILNLSEVDQSILKPIEVLKQVFQNFLQFWVTTVFLVIEEYFDNTFSDEQNLKRERDFSFQDFEEDFSAEGFSIFGNPSKRMLSFSE